MHGKSARFIEIYEKLWQIWWLEIPGYWPCVSIAWVVQADLGSENSMLRGNRASFFSTYIATTKNWVLFFLQYRGNDLLIFQDDEAKKEEAARKNAAAQLASLCRYPSHSSWWKSDVHCLFVFYIHPLRTINKPLPNLLDKGSNDTWAKNVSSIIPTSV